MSYGVQSLSLLCILMPLYTLGFEALEPEVKSQRSMPIYNRPEKRLFESEAVESLMADIGRGIVDPYVNQTFHNCLPSTLDTTVYWHNFVDGMPKSFIITGDIPALWLRDSTHQISPYLPLMKSDPKLKNLVLGLLNLQADLVVKYPWANAYFAPDYTQVENMPNEWSEKDVVSPRYNSSEVFEAKYELDSLASFLYLASRYYSESNDDSFTRNPVWISAVSKVVEVMRSQQAGTFEQVGKETFKFSRPTVTQSETTNLYGIGNPVSRCGLIRSFFRPSDDATIFQYLIPSNAMAVVALEGVATALEKSTVKNNLATEMRSLAAEVRAAISKWAIVTHPVKGQVYAYEVDCYGSHVLMDDANFPSLLSLPHFGFLPKDDPVYLRTREYILDSKWNPYYFDGLYPGIGSPHTPLNQPWHMAVAMQAMTSADDGEIARLLTQLGKTTAGTGLMHESYNVNDPSIFTRPWFAWSNTVFGDLVIHLHKNRPHILRGERAPPPQTSDSQSRNVLSYILGFLLLTNCIL